MLFRKGSFSAAELEHDTVSGVLNRCGLGTYCGPPELTGKINELRLVMCGWKFDK